MIDTHEAELAMGTILEPDKDATGFTRIAYDDGEEDLITTATILGPVSVSSNQKLIDRFRNRN